MPSSPPAHPAETPRVLIIRRRDVGDVLLLASTLYDLKAQWPTAKIALLVDRSCSEAARLHGTLDQLLVFPTRLPQWPGFWQTLRRSGFTHVLDLDNTAPSAGVTWLTRAPHRATWERPPRRVRFGRVYHHITRLPTMGNGRHLTDDYGAAMGAWGVERRSANHRIHPRARDLDRARSLVAGPQLRVGVHVGTRSPTLAWPAERFARLCDRLQDERDAQVFLLGGRRESRVIEKIRSQAETHLTRLDPQLTLGELGAVISQLDLLVCHDSDAMLLAAAVGTPVVALYGSQDATIRRPPGSAHAVLRPQSPCTCAATGQMPASCIKSDPHQSYCVRRLDEATVFDAVVSQLSQHRPSA